MPLTRRRRLQIVIVSLLVIVACVVFATMWAHAGQLDATWIAPTTNVDGTALTDLASYRVYFSTTTTPCPGPTFSTKQSSTAAPGPNLTEAQNLPGLVQGTRYFVAVTAVDLAGNESACSVTANAVARTDTDTIPPPNAGPPQLSAPILTVNGAQYTANWAASIDQPSNTPVPKYTWRAAFNDGTSLISGTVTTNALTFTMPFYSTGAASPAFLCVVAVDAAGNLSASDACNGFTVPATPNAPPSPVQGIIVK